MFSGGLGVTDAAVESMQVKSERLEITTSACSSTSSPLCGIYRQFCGAHVQLFNISKLAATFQKANV